MDLCLRAEYIQYVQLFLCLMQRDTLWGHLPVSSYRVLWDQAVGITLEPQSKFTSSFQCWSIIVLPWVIKTPLIQRICSSFEMHEHRTKDSKNGCVATSTGELCFADLCAEQVKVLSPTQGVLLEILFYLFFMTFPLCVPWEVWKHKLQGSKPEGKRPSS